MNDRPSDLAAALAALSPQKRELLALELAGRRRGGDASVIPRLPRDGWPARFPAAPGQERLWFLHELDPDSVAYVLPIAVRLRGSVDVAALHAAIAWLVARHEALRTGFEVNAEGVVLQVVQAPDAVTPEIVTADVKAAEIPDRVRTLCQKFDLGAPSLARAGVFRVTDGSDAEQVLVLCVHHIVVDGWSLGVLVDELEIGYTAFAAGRSPATADPALQYADYAGWQHERLATGELSGQLDFWRTELAGAVPLQVPADRVVTGMRSSAGDAVPVGLPADLVARLHELGRAERATPFMVLLSALAVVLSRWSGQDEVLVGTPVAGRPRTELERLVGFFVNTVPLRIPICGTESFRQLVRRVRAVCLAAFAHQDVPFDRVVQELGARGPGHPPLVQVMFALRDVELRAPRLPGLSAEVLELPGGGAQLDLTLELWPTAEGSIDGSLEFATDLFAEPSVGRLIDGFGQVLRAAQADPDGPVHSLPVLTDAELRRVQTEFSGAGSVPGPAAVLSRGFEAMVDVAGDSIALVVDEPAVGPALTYRELDVRANRLARYLQAQGIGAEDRVGVCLDRGVDLVVAVLAVLKSGAAYLPLDPGVVPARLAAILDEARPRLVLTGRRLAGLVAEGPVVCLDELASELARWSADRLARSPHPDSAAYLLFTSGSTGRPKGVVTTHAAIANRIAQMISGDDLRPGERVLQKTPISFDPSVTEMLAPLLAGAVLVALAPDRHGDPCYLLDAIGRHRITSADVVPSMLRLLLDDPEVAGRLVGLRRLYCGGEVLPADLARRFIALFPDVRLINLYGPTEAAVDASRYAVTRPVPDRVPIGRPIGGVELYILDEHFRVQPVGVPGQVYLGGVQLARGYLGRPGLTAERFVPHPFQPGRRLYDTGDLARWLPDGQVDFLGRTDGQLKIRGTRVEPAEIEVALRDHPLVDDAVVVSLGSGETAGLVGYLVPVPEVAPSAASLRAFLSERLPAAMVPGRFEWLAAFPLTAGGKIDRPRLPSPTRPEGDRTAPATALEQVLAGIWSDVLGIPEPGVLDDFYSLGGHSLLATQIVARTADLLRVELSLRDFMAISTVRDLADLVRTTAGAAGVDVDRVATVILTVSAMSADEVAANLRTEPVPTTP
jgi:amino acid adenylation domain-containing protein